jgi:hypothetical protein
MTAIKYKKDNHGRNGKITKIVAYYPFVFLITTPRSEDGQ